MSGSNPAGFGEVTQTGQQAPNKFDNEVKASELTFNDDPTGTTNKEPNKFDSDRPTNKQDEDRQLEVNTTLTMTHHHDSLFRWHWRCHVMK